jgi:hypothetical protein
MTTSILSYTTQDDRGGFLPLWQKSATPRISHVRREVARLRRRQRRIMRTFASARRAAPPTSGATLS